MRENLFRGKRIDNLHIKDKVEEIEKEATR